MIGTLADAAVRAAALAGAIALLLWIARVRSATLRLHVWRAGLLASCLIPLWTTVTPSSAKLEVERPFDLPLLLPAAEPAPPIPAVAAAPGLAPSSGQSERSQRGRQGPRGLPEVARTGRGSRKT